MSLDEEDGDGSWHRIGGGQRTTRRPRVHVVVVPVPIPAVVAFGVAAVAVVVRVVHAEPAIVLAAEDPEPRTWRVSIRSVTERGRETDPHDMLLRLSPIRGGSSDIGLQLRGAGPKPDSI